MPANASTEDARLTRFAAALEAGGFSGDIETGFAAREVLATDNSIYRLPPVAVIFPRERADIAIAARALASCRPEGLSLTARGGGTGTNGQSLNDGVVLDASRYLTGIIDFNAEAGRVTAEPGVVLDQLNSYLAPSGWFFPPTVSTASRATLGGMVATDASGKGSRCYGRTSDYIERLDIVLADGSEASIAPLDEKEAAECASRQDRLGEIVRQVQTALEAGRPHFKAAFPKMNRGLTGYNLLQALPESGGLNLCKLLAGSEGTLALTSAITLRLKRKPHLSGLVVLFYDDFAKALNHVPFLVKADPLAVEILDDKILDMARRDPVWVTLSELFGDLPPAVGAVNFLEVVGDTPEEIDAQIARIATLLDGDDTAFRIKSVTDPAAIRAAWSLRAKAVGLLGALGGARKAIPFVEDTAVPPENLSGYVTEFRALLDSFGVAYGMFGHADVGCLHVRPTLDMTEAADRAMIRRISDGVQALTRAHGGLIWGEHGRGVRGEYLEEVFGPALYPLVRQIKGVFDPGNRFNPGKLAAPPDRREPIMRIDDVPFRGARDAQISAADRVVFDRAIACNGNGACHDWNPAQSMCPSYKVTRDKTQSPNGRAALIRAWARKPGPETSAALKASLDTCLSCRACASACPVKVDIPTMKAQFLERYYRRRFRSLRDIVVRLMEPAILALRHSPRVANAVLHNPVSRYVAHRIGLVDLPRFAELSLEARMRRAGVPWLDLAHLPADPGTVIVVPDSFLGCFDPVPIVAAAELLAALGFNPVIAPVAANGKALEVRGFAEAYARTKERAQEQLSAYAATGFPVLAIEPATYIQARADGAHFLQSIDGFLHSNWLESVVVKDERAAMRLMLHCTEKTQDPGTGTRWQSIFHRFGVDLEVIDAGCCGMSGLFGHEAEHRAMSEKIFALSWVEPLGKANAMATGFSCRCQASRFGSQKLSHPLEVLARLARRRVETHG